MIKCNRPRRAFNTAAIALSLTLSVNPASALIVQHSVGATLPSGLPLDAVGTWGNNAGAVAVAPGWVLTTRHQDSLASPPDRTVVIDGNSYTADVDNQILFDSGGTTVDLRLVPIFDGSGDPAELTSFVEVYDGSLGIPTLTAITGFGPTIGSADTDGFDWLGTFNNANGLHVGQNNIDLVDSLGGGTYSGMSVLVADFDELGTSDPGGSVDFEATGSFGDSGGAWFVNDGGTWKITGLTHGVEFNNDHNAQAFFGQQFLAVDLRDFATTINNIPEPAALTLLLSGTALLRSRRRRDA